MLESHSADAQNGQRPWRESTRIRFGMFVAASMWLLGSSDVAGQDTSGYQLAPGIRPPSSSSGWTAPSFSLTSSDRSAANSPSASFAPYRPDTAPRYHLPAPPGWTAAEFISEGVLREPVPEQLPSTLPSTRLKTHKDGFFQKLSASYAWIPKTQGELAISETQVFTTVAVPAPTREWPMLITPSFRLFLLDGPAAPDVPAQVYDTWLEFLWVPRFSPHWQGIFSVSPGFYSDFNSGYEDAFRLTGRALVRYQWKPDQFEIVLGVLYPNRDDVRILPAGGIIWQPHDDARYELIFPKPKLAWRYRYGADFEDWVYLGGEFGGDTWSVQRDSGQSDKLTLRDYRFILGIERRFGGGAGVQLEVGYVFARSLEYASSSTELNFSDSLMLRAIASF